MILRACINLHSNYSRKNLPSDQVSRRWKLENNNTARVFLAEYVGPDAGAEVARRKLAQFQEESTYIF